MYTYFQESEELEKWLDLAIDKISTVSVPSGSEADSEFYNGKQAIEKIINFLRQIPELPEESLPDGVKQLIEQRLTDHQAIDDLIKFYQLLDEMISTVLRTSQVIPALSSSICNINYNRELINQDKTDNHNREEDQYLNNQSPKDTNSACTLSSKITLVGGNTPKIRQSLNGDCVPLNRRIWNSEGVAEFKAENTTVDTEMREKIENQGAAKIDTGEFNEIVIEKVKEELKEIAIDKVEEDIEEREEEREKEVGDIKEVRVEIERDGEQLNTQEEVNKNESEAFNDIKIDLEVIEIEVNSNGEANKVATEKNISESNVLEINEAESNDSKSIEIYLEIDEVKKEESENKDNDIKQHVEEDDSSENSLSKEYTPEKKLPSEKSSVSLGSIQEVGSSIAPSIKISQHTQSSNPNRVVRSSRIPSDGGRLARVLKELFPKSVVRWNTKMGLYRFYAQIENLLIYVIEDYSTNEDNIIKLKKDFRKQGWYVYVCRKEDLKFPRRLERGINLTIPKRKV